MGSGLRVFVGGKIYNTLKWIMTGKTVVVLGFLGLLAVFYSSPATWTEIGARFLQFGSFPVGAAGTENVFVSVIAGRGAPRIQLEPLCLMGAFAAVAGWGGLSQMAISNYTRDQGCCSY